MENFFNGLSPLGAIAYYATTKTVDSFCIEVYSIFRIICNKQGDEIGIISNGPILYESLLYPILRQAFSDMLYPASAPDLDSLYHFCQEGFFFSFRRKARFSNIFPSCNFPIL